jgi:hypothetical protein
VHTAAALLKNFFSSLPEPLFPFPFYDDVNKYFASGNPDPKGAKEIVEKVKKLTIESFLVSHLVTLSSFLQLPPINRLTLGFLMSYLNRVCSYSAQNKMTHANMGIVGKKEMRSEEEYKEKKSKDEDSRREK